jgi:hypothetical protein
MTCEVPFPLNVKLRARAVAASIASSPKRISGSKLARPPSMQGLPVLLLLPVSLRAAAVMEAFSLAKSKTRTAH